MASTRTTHHSASADPKIARVLSEIRRRDQMTSAKWIIQVLCGLPLLIVAPLVLGTIFWLITLNLHGYLPWTWFFLGMAVVVIPSMFMGEARQRGGFFGGRNYDATIGGIDGRPLSPVPVAVMGDYGMLVDFATNPRLAASGLVEIFLLGPRLIMDGLTTVRKARQVRSASRERAAQIVVQLLKFDQGIPTASVIPKDAGAGESIQALCLLGFQDWIGLSKDADRVWLLSNERKRLVS